jgi:hypothetical protein
MLHSFSRMTPDETASGRGTSAGEPTPLPDYKNVLDQSLYAYSVIVKLPAASRKSAG